jgi:hypothetical protein
MNWKKLWIAFIVVYVVYQITNLIIHSVILMGFYDQLSIDGVFRSAADMPGWVFWITAIVFSFFFVFIFAKGYENRGIGEGIRYGFYVGMLFFFVGSFDQFVTYPLPYSLAWYWIILGVIQAIICGVVAALVYKPKSATA